MAVVTSRSSRRPDILGDFLARVEFWEPHLWRGELSDLAGALGRYFSVVEIARAVASIEDRFTRTTMLVQLADGVTDKVMKVSLLADARHEAWDVEDGNYDYALKHVVSGFIDAGMFAEAGEAVDAMRNPEIRLDYLAYLSSALEKAGKGDEADKILSDRSELESVNPDTRPQSELLAEAESLLEMDLDPDFPSIRTLFGSVETDVRAGRFDEALTAIRQHFPTLFCPASLELDSDTLRQLLLFQIERVRSFNRNDLKVEFLTDLAGTAHARAAEIPSEIEGAISTSEFLRLEPAAVPSVHSVDPSVLEFSEFVRVLFERPVPLNDEEQRIYDRERAEDPDVSDPEALVRLATELFLCFGEVAPKFSPEQVNQAMWTLLGHPYWLYEAMTEDGVREESVIDCLEAAYRVFADYVSLTKLPDFSSKFNMWWDEFWKFESPKVWAALFGTMVRVLELPEEESRYAALHGLGHLVGRNTPVEGVAAAIDSFLSRHEGELSDKLYGYARNARVGEIL
ncbi:hypothetical protein [Candidatus Amarobacter glycogenicus]|uniref:hypothetical protein n=1 Tax=Candidatus Amarobacter glycogenicus TaxID=3140699 RepID=UPI003134D6B1|nr:hypothetical protein [Dehalococcoidia bacterium]